MKARRYYALLASAGFTSAMTLFAYAEITHYAPTNPVLAPLAAVLCPPLVPAAYLLFDLNGHSFEMTIAWLFIALVNACVYVGVGAIARALLKRRRQTASA